MADVTPLHPPAHPGQPAPPKGRALRRRQRRRQRGTHLTKHPLARHRLKGHTPAPDAAAPVQSEKGPT